MKFIKAAALILLAAKISMAQTDPKIYSTMSFFYIDNSSGGTPPGLNQEVQNYLKLKMSDEEKLKDNYVSTFVVDGKNSVLSDNITKTVSFDHLAKYLSKGSASADYAFDNDTLKASFIHNQVAIKNELTFYIFISSKEVDKMIKEMNETPTPVSFPYQLAAYLIHEKVLHPNIYFITNKDVQSKYTDAQILRCFTFYQDKSSDVNPVPTVMFK